MFGLMFGYRRGAAMSARKMRISGQFQENRPGDMRFLFEKILYPPQNCRKNIYQGRIRKIIIRKLKI